MQLQSTDFKKNNKSQIERILKKPRDVKKLTLRYINFKLKNIKGR